MAYNLQPLITILEQILDPKKECPIHDDSKPQLKSLLEKAVSLQLILEKNSSLPNIENLEREIRDAAHKAEDIIESHMVDRMLSASLNQAEDNIESSMVDRMLKSFISFISRGLSLERNIRNAAHKEEDIIESCMADRMLLADLPQVTQELDSAMEQVVKLMEVKAGNKIISSTSRGTSSSSGGGDASFSLNPKSARASTMVGFDEDLMELKERLVGMPSKLEIIPIVGMGGAGKTTLARNLYEDPLIVSRFQYARAWATVSQDYNMRTILLSLVSCINGKEVVDGEVSELKDSLYKSLYGRRYLIVLDDIWSIQVWDKMRMYFPENNNGSRVVITTRESNVATHANSKSKQHAMKFLDKSASWDLLRQIVFGKDDFPSELVSIVEEIASDCGGLPLAITVIGGLLSKAERSRDVWENIGENVRGAIARSGRMSNILAYYL